MNLAAMSRLASQASTTAMCIESDVGL